MTMTKFLVDSVTESVFSLKLWRSLVLVKILTFVMNGNDIVCDGVCSKASGRSGRYKSFTKNGSDGVCPGASFW